MGFSLVNNTGASGTSNSVTTTAKDTTGATLIVLGVSYNTGAVPTIVDSASNTWTALTAQSVAANGVSRLYYCVNPITSATHTFSNTGASNFCALTMQAWSGNGNLPLEQNLGTTNAASATLAPGSVSPTQANELIVTHNMFSVGGTASVNGGFTITDQVNFGSGNNYGGALAYLIQTAATAANPTWTAGGGASGIAATIACFKIIPRTGTPGNVGAFLTVSNGMSRSEVAN